MRYQYFILSKAWLRHGKFSGYECLIDYLKFPYNIVNGFFLPYKLAHFFGKQTKLKNYKGLTSSKEFQIMKMFWRPKTVHILYGDMDFYYLHYLKSFPFNLRKSVVIATFHHPPKELENRLQYNKERVLGALDKIIVMGRNQIPFFQQYSNAEINFIPHGINTKYFTYNQNIQRTKIILIIGVSHRDHERNIKIINSVNEYLAVKFLVFMSSEYAILYRGLANVEINTNIVSDSDLLWYYQSSSAVLLSLTDCTASNTILEALACGCPLVVNNVGAVQDYIPKSSGIPVFDTMDIDGTVSHIVRLFEDADYSIKISRLQRQLALNYDWDIVTRATEDFIFKK